MFIWTIAHQSMLIDENLQKIGIVGLSRCTLCYQQVKDSKHIVLECKYAKKNWHEVLGP